MCEREDESAGVSYLRSVGFMDTVEDTLARMGPRMVKGLNREGTAPGFDQLKVYTDPSGTSMCFFEPVGGSLDFSLTVLGPAKVNARLWQPVPGTAVAAVLDENGQLDEHILVWVDEPNLFPVYELSAVGAGTLVRNFCIGAIAVEVEVFETVEAWKATQTPIDAPELAKRFPWMPDKVYIAPDFVLSPWLFAMFAGREKAEDVSSVSMVHAVCKEVQIVTNLLTGRRWYKVVADCGIPVNLALPIDIEPAPRPGSVVEGKMMLTGTTGSWWQDCTP